MTALLTCRQLADRWQVSVRTVMRWKKNRLITSTRIGRNIRFSMAAIEQAEKLRKAAI